MTQEQQPSAFRPVRALLGGLLLLWPPMWFRLLERGAFVDLPRWAGAALLASLIASIFGGVILLGRGLGLLDSDTLASGDLGRAPTLPDFITVYLGSLAVAIIGALLGAYLFQVHPLRAGFVIVGAQFLLAASGKPWWLHATMRRLGWFSQIKSDATIRRLFSAIGAAAVSAGLFLPDALIN